MKKSRATQVKGITPSKGLKKVSGRKSVIIITVFLGVFAVGLLWSVSSTFFKDRLLALGFQPTEELTLLEENLSLTPAAELIFRASRPVLHSEIDFSSYCQAASAEDSVLGCYSDGIIHVYNIDSQELAGIVESTTAHELLHAVWERLAGGEKDRLFTWLTTVYNNNADSLSIISEYPSTAQASELYARVGTEIAELPVELEEHYAQYFDNRAALVAYYNNYADVFKELERSLEDLSVRLGDLERIVTAEKDDYTARGETFSIAVDEFNNCAANNGCFSEEAFATRRQELLSEQAALSGLYTQISDHILEYNQLVEQYNAHLLHQQELVKIINSNERIKYD